jgi:hypothetical protein
MTSRKLPRCFGKEIVRMPSASSNIKGYLFAAFLGAAVGGIVALLVTRAIPNVMPGMMQAMMARMGEEGCDPAAM